MNLGRNTAWRHVGTGSYKRSVDVNVAVKDGGERVEFAVKLPGRGDDPMRLYGCP